MSEKDCRQAREKLALGETVGIESHLRGCTVCSREAERYGAILDSLAADREIPVPPQLDTTVREMFAEADRASRHALKPVPAAGLVIAALLAIITGLLTAVAETGAGVKGMAWVIAAVVLHLAISTAVAVPVLVGRIPAIVSRPATDEV